MKDPPDGVIDPLFLRKSLVSTLVGNDPEAGSDEARSKAVETPERVPYGVIKSGVWKRYVFWGDVLFGGDRRLVDASK